MMKQLQRLGRSLMLPVAALPAGGILLGIGYALDPTGWGANSVVSAFLVHAGGTILDNMGILFAIGVAFGLSKDQNGAAALSGAVGFLLMMRMLNAAGSFIGELSEVQALAFGRANNAFTGILTGCITAFIYNRNYQRELPAALAFFSGRRLVPILTVAAMSVISLAMMFVWPIIFGALVTFGEFISGLGAFGAALYGFFNRLLIPTGLHHALNAVFWFDFVGINDLGRFWGPVVEADIGTVGMYMAGFFPVMMFGLPGACLAIFRNAKDKNKKVVSGLMLAAAFTAFFTGVTEPIEFSFMFVAPVLYLIHAILTGISMFVTATFQWFAGFNFSAGFIDFMFSIPVPYAVGQIWLVVFGIFYFFIYFFIFNFAIKKFNLKTPGREDEDDLEAEKTAVLASDDYTAVAAKILEGLGGKDNVTEVEYCATRVRAVIKDYLLVDEKIIKSAGVAGVIRPSKTSVQVVVGTKVQFVADEILKML